MTVRFHPLALVTAALLVLTFVVCIGFSAPARWAHVIATTLLVSPLILLFWAHLRIAISRGQNIWLVLCALALGFLSFFSAFLLAWFKPGWYGVFVFTAVLSALAGLCILPLRNRGPGDAA